MVVRLTMDPAATALAIVLVVTAPVDTQAIRSRPTPVATALTATAPATHPQAIRRIRLRPIQAVTDLVTQRRPAAIHTASQAKAIAIRMVRHPIARATALMAQRHRAMATQRQRVVRRLLTATARPAMARHIAATQPAAPTILVAAMAAAPHMPAAHAGHIAAAEHTAAMQNANAQNVIVRSQAVALAPSQAQASAQRLVVTTAGTLQSARWQAAHWAPIPATDQFSAIRSDPT